MCYRLSGKNYYPEDLICLLTCGINTINNLNPVDIFIENEYYLILY